MTTIRFATVGFDLDGTLLDTSRDLGVALNHALAAIDRPPVPQAAVMNLIGGGSGLMLRRALSNLLSNALRYAPAGSVVDVQLGHDAGAVWVRVTNPCPGLDTLSLDRLFDRFYRGDPARRASGDGAGLGLAITRSIAHAHGGELKVEKHDGQICFELRWPG